MSHRNNPDDTGGCLTDSQFLAIMEGLQTVTVPMTDEELAELSALELPAFSEVRIARRQPKPATRRVRKWLRLK